MSGSHSRWPSPAVPAKSVDDCFASWHSFLIRFPRSRHSCWSVDFAAMKLNALHMSAQRQGIVGENPSVLDLDAPIPISSPSRTDVINESTWQQQGCGGEEMVVCRSANTTGLADEVRRLAGFPIDTAPPVQVIGIFSGKMRRILDKHKVGPFRNLCTSCSNSLIGIEYVNTVNSAA